MTIINAASTLSLPVKVATILAEQVKDQPADKQVQTVVEEKHFPELPKDQRVIIFNGLRRQGALQTWNWNDDFYEHPSELKELIVVYSKQSITPCMRTRSSYSATFRIKKRDTYGLRSEPDSKRQPGKPGGQFLAETDW